MNLHLIIYVIKNKTIYSVSASKHDALVLQQFFCYTSRIINGGTYSFLRSFYSVITKIKSNNFLRLYSPDDKPFSVRFPIPAEAIRLVGK